MKPPGVRLPRVYSASTSIGACTIEWFRRDPRPEPLAPPEWTIYHYDRLTHEVQRLMEEFVDERLTEMEGEALRRYLQKARGWDLTLRQEPLPVRYVTDPERMRLTTYRQRIGDSSRYTGFYKLSDEKGYDLPFQVWGYYNPMSMIPTGSANVYPDSSVMIYLDLEDGSV